MHSKKQEFLAPLKTLPCLASQTPSFQAILPQTLPNPDVRIENN